MGGDVEASIFEVVASSQKTSETGGDRGCDVGAVGEVLTVFDEYLGM